MARPMTPEATELRRQVVVAVQAEIDQGRQPDRLSIARRFRGRAPATTLLRWVDGAVSEVHHNPAATCSGGAAEEPVALIAETAAADSGELQDCGDAPELPAGDTAAVTVDWPPQRTAAGSCADDPAGAGPDVTVTLHPAELLRLDSWRRCQPGQPDRAAALRLLVLTALRVPAST
jgi:hypothetical protein